MPLSNQRLPALAVFARAPVPGKTKTRLNPLLGPRGAAEFQAALISDALSKIKSLSNVAPYFFLSSRSFPASSGGKGVALRYQRGAGLGERLGDAFRRLLTSHDRAIAIGTDSPFLSQRRLREALVELKTCDAVLGPCPDGGFYLIGLRRLPRGLFGGVRWGSRYAFRDMLRNLMQRQVSCSVLEPETDIDRPRDVERLAAKMRASSAARRRAPASWNYLKTWQVKARRPASGKQARIRVRPGRSTRLR